MPIARPTRARALPCAAAALLTLALAGCFWPGGAPDATDPDASAEPAEPITDAVGPAAECGEAVFWGGVPEGEIPTAAEYRAGFALPDVLEGFDVLCSASWTYPQNDCQMDFARAYIDGGEQGGRLEEIDESLETWATGHGLEQTRIGKADNTRSFGIEVDPDPEMGAAVMTQLSWDAVSRYEGATEVQRHADMAGIPLDGGDVLVTWQVCPALQGWETPGVPPSSEPGASGGTETPAPIASATPTLQAAPYCGDEFVLAMLSTGPGMALNSVEEVLEQSGARGGFEPATAIEGLDVHCTAIYRSPTDGAGLVTVSVAVLLRDDAAFTQLEEWSAANGYEPAPGSDSQTYAERYAPATADGMTTTKILWMPLDSDSPTLGDAPLIIATTGAPPDAIMVWFSDYTQP